jgi:hypothetical protein
MNQDSQQVQAIAVAVAVAVAVARDFAFALPLLWGPHPQRRSQRAKPEGRRAWMHVVFCRGMDAASENPAGGVNP